MKPIKKSRYPLAKKKKFIELRARGLSLQAIAKALKVAKGTAVDWNKDFRDEVAAARAFELEALLEEYYLTRETKIRLFGEKIRAVLTELGRRDLSDIPTARLFDILAQYHGLLGKEAIEPVFKTPDEIAKEQQSLQALERMVGTLTGT